jgi:serine/threonine protein kinase
LGIAENLVGHQVPGRDKKIWTVVERISGEEDKSGMFHSIGYKVKSDDGREAFMKVTDLDLLTDSEYSVYERTKVAIQAHSIERQMLEHCRGNNMDRIVVAIDFGDTVITHAGCREPIFYLMFDLAESDVRVHVDKRSRFDRIWTLGALHDLAVAIQQLHKGSVCHNDIKPENLLVFRGLSFKERLQKLADLGCATSPLMASIYDDALCAGDPRYAAPEVLYGNASNKSLCSFEARRAMDIFHLGSMVFFLIVGRMLTPEIIRHLAPEHRPPSDHDDWNGSLLDIIPYWREAFGRVLEIFVEKLPKNLDGSLTQLGVSLLSALKELTEPDPSLRGHPQNRSGQNDALSVQQYVSLFNSLRRRSLH